MSRLRAEAANTARLIAYPFAAAAVIAYGTGCVIAAEAGRKILGRRDGTHA